MKNIVVIGSSNTDMVVKTSHLPAGGETVLGGDFFMNAGGKGANQAVAAARYGAEVSFLAAVGSDSYDSVESFLSAEGIKSVLVKKEEGTHKWILFKKSEIPFDFIYL